MELIASADAHSAAAPAQVWDCLVDGLRWSRWSASAEWMVVEGALAPGTYVTIKRKRSRQTAYRIEAAEAPHCLALLLTFGPMARLRLTWTLGPAGTGTAIRQTIESGGPLRRWLTDPAARRGATAWRDDPARLAEVAAAEAGSAPA